MDYDEADTCWHLMVTTEGGTVSILKNLDAPTARQAYRRLRPREHPKKYINAEKGRGFGAVDGGIVRDSDIRTVDVIGPEGAKLDPWRGVEPQVIDLANERQRWRAFG